MATWGKYDIDGKPIDTMTWAMLLNDADYKYVACSFADDTSVSTVWLGLDHSFSVSEEKLIFETMIFGGTRDGEVWRWSTLEEAIVGHIYVCLKLGLAPFAKNWDIAWTHA